MWCNVAYEIIQSEKCNSIQPSIQPRQLLILFKNGQDLLD